jgi:hypothetical protein
MKKRGLCVKYVECHNNLEGFNGKCWPGALQAQGQHLASAQACCVTCIESVVLCQQQVQGCDLPAGLQPAVLQLDPAGVPVLVQACFLH